MLLIEKVVKLLSDFHTDIFHEYVKNISVRSYYPLALIDVITRDMEVEQESEKLYRDVYGESPKGEKDMKKFFQLAHYTFKLTGHLAKNYPDYLSHNITRIQHLINIGELDQALLVAHAVKDVAEKVEDFDTEIKVLNILAQSAIQLESNKQALLHYERIDELMGYNKDLNDLNLFLLQKFKNKGKDNDEESLNEILDFLAPYKKSKSFAVRKMARLNTCFAMHLYRDSRFYQKAVFRELEAIEEQLLKNEYIIVPYLYNLMPKLSFLKLNYSIKELSQEEILTAAKTLMEESKNNLFWNSFVNVPEINSIAIQSSFYVSNFFFSYRDNHLELLSAETSHQLEFLRERCRMLLNNKLLEEKFVIRYINLTTIYAGLLLLGGKKEIEKSIETLENLLIFYQQVPFHAYIDTIYTVMILGGFCLKDFDRVEKFYRRYKKSTKDKVVNPENDLSLHGFYFLAKWLETSRKQYINKLTTILDETQDKPNLASTRKSLIDAISYYQVPISLKLLKNP